jgi:hypothetical protein
MYISIYTHQYVNICICIFSMYITRCKYIYLYTLNVYYQVYGPWTALLKFGILDDGAGSACVCVCVGVSVSLYVSICMYIDALTSCMSIGMCTCVHVYMCCALRVL